MIRKNTNNMAQLYITVAHYVQLNASDFEILAEDGKTFDPDEAFAFLPSEGYAKD